MDYTRARYIPGFSYGARLIVLLIVFICGIVLTGFLSGFLSLGEGASRTGLLWSVVVQNVCTFAMPALLAAWILTRRPMQFTGLAHGFSFRALIGLILIFAAGLPFLNQLVAWNEAVRLPAELSALEAKMQAMEAAARAMSDKLLDAKGVGDMLTGVLIIGCVTGFCEELFFRGALQRLLQRKSVNPQVVVWIAALVFSILHFQFYGFVPRLLLGAFFGYLLLWSDSLWLPALAHSINNSLVVVSSWLMARGWASDLDRFGVVDEGFPWPACVSIIVVLLLLIAGRNWLFKRKTIDRYG